MEIMDKRWDWWFLVSVGVCDIYPILVAWKGIPIVLY